jgi:hypothetical protein
MRSFPRPHGPPDSALKRASSSVPGIGTSRAVSDRVDVVCPISKPPVLADATAASGAHGADLDPCPSVEDVRTAAS